MKTKNFFQLLSLVTVSILLVASACKDKEQSVASTGGISVQIIWPSHSQSYSTTAPQFATMPSAVVTVKFLVSASDMTTQEKSFDASAGTGTISGIPVGTNRTLTIQGLNSDGTILYSATQTGISVTQGTSEDVGVVTMTPTSDAYRWRYIHDEGAGINTDVSHDNQKPKLVYNSTRLFAAWREDISTDTHIRVAKWDNIGGWVFADNNSGINKNISQAVTNNFTLKTSIAGVTAAWSEQSMSNNGNIRVASYSIGDSQFAFIDGDHSSDGINRVPNLSGDYPALASLNSNLYAAWSEYNASNDEQLRVAKWDGEGTQTWSFIDGDVTNDGINKNSSLNARYSKLISFQNKLYAAWVETDFSTYKLRIAEWHGEGTQTWSFVDGNGTDGINVTPSRKIEDLEIIVYEDELYIAWYEMQITPDLLLKLYFAKWDGNQSWEFLDGGENGLLNKDTTLAAFPNLAILNGKLFMTWIKSNGTRLQLRVAEWNKTDSSWTFIDGGGVNGLNPDPTLDAFTPYLISTNDRLFAAWEETPDVINNQDAPRQLRVAVWELIP